MTATTPDPNNRPRGARGRFRRLPANVDRDARAAELWARGWTFSAIANELGYSDKAGAWRGVQAAMAETVYRERAVEARERQLAELALLRSRMWRVVDDPGPAVDRLGRPVHDDDGNVVPDEQARANAATVILRASEREARLRGTDAPRRSTVQSVMASLSAEDIRAHIAQLRAEVEQADPPALPGTVETS